MNIELYIIRFREKMGFMLTKVRKRVTIWVTIIGMHKMGSKEKNEIDEVPDFPKMGPNEGVNVSKSSPNRG